MSDYSLSDYSSDWPPAWTWSDYGQSRRIMELRDEMSSMSSSLAVARSSTRRLESELSKVTGSLEQRLNRLSAAFDAFVEISDLRVTLALFDEHARVRHRARQMFGEHPLPGELSDVDGYWLAPALAALRATVDGGSPAGPLELARSRDPRRAAVFHVLATVLLGLRDAGSELIAGALPELDASPAMYQRAVWLLAADGQLGAGARELVAHRAADSLATLDEQDRNTAVRAWEKAIKTEHAPEVPKELGQATDLINALDACERLTVLRQWVEAGLEWDGKPADEVDPLVRRALQSLVDEGSPLELPLLTRERELRKVIESGSSGRKPDGWESPVEPMVELLRKDVVDDERPGRRALAIRICGQHILEAADRLADRARAPIADEVPARIASSTVTVTRNGVVEASLEKAVARRVAAAYTVDPRRRSVGYLALGTGLGLVVLGIMAGWGWLIPAAVAFAVAGWQFWRRRTELARAAEHESATRRTARAEAEKCVAHYSRARADLTMRQARIDEDLAALRATLAG